METRLNRVMSSSFLLRMVVAVASQAWDLLGDARESLRLLDLARSMVRRGFVRRWGACPACSDAVARIAGAPD